MKNGADRPAKRGDSHGRLDGRTTGARNFKKLLETADSPDVQERMLRERVASLQIICRRFEVAQAAGKQCDVSLPTYTSATGQLARCIERLNALVKQQPPEPEAVAAPTEMQQRLAEMTDWEFAEVCRRAGHGAPDYQARLQMWEQQKRDDEASQARTEMWRARVVEARERFLAEQAAAQEAEAAAAARAAHTEDDLEWAIPIIRSLI